MMTLRFPCEGLAPMMFALTRFGSSTSLYGVSSIDLPAYLFSSGLTSKLSKWLMPPHKKIQMTDLAFEGKCGWPSGGRHAGEAASANATPSRNSIADNASLEKPIPVSTRNERREMPQQRLN